MSIITILLIVIVALLAGMEGVLDEFQFHQPLVACTLIGIVSGHMKEGIILGGSLQMMALGWANVGERLLRMPPWLLLHRQSSWYWDCRVEQPM